MDTLFGLSMTTIMAVLAALFGACVALVLGVWLANRTMFRMGLRNVPRRRAQTGLIVLGLMLSTLLITASFATGDTLDYSITKTSYDILQRNDLRIDLRGEDGGLDAASEQTYVRETLAAELTYSFQQDPDIAGFLPYLAEPVPAINPRTRLSEPVVFLMGIDPAALEPLGGLRLAGGGRADLSRLGEGRVYLSEKLAAKLDARAGDTLMVFAQGQPYPIEVLGLVRDELASGVLYAGSAGGMAAAIADVQRITGHAGQINLVAVALRGGVRDTLERSATAKATLEAYFHTDSGKLLLGLGELDANVVEMKKENVETAELVGNVFTMVFIIFGLFSIAAGVMLIFTIFVMLAAERKTEMGIARAVGAQRIHLVQSFLAEGLAYNVLAGFAGVALGVLAAFGLVVVGVKMVLGDQLEFISPYVSARTLVVSYCLGTVITFFTVLISSVRVSRLNIVTAIRGQEEHARREHRHRTRWWMVALGVPLSVLLPPLGLYVLLRRGFGLPWVWVTGPTGVLTALVLLVIGYRGGLAFPFTLGMSLLPLCIAVILRYYGVPDRPLWTAVGVYLLAYWLLPGDWHDDIFGRMTGDMEMFVLSGLWIVTAFTMVISFNARLLTKLAAGAGEAGRSAYRVTEILAGMAAGSAAAGFVFRGSAGGLGDLFLLLAAVLALGALVAFAAARFAWFAPALKMGVAYPLANRFRTGMTIAMFSLIIFSLVMMSVIDAAFMGMFATTEAKGGWDVVVHTNRNNPVADLRAALAEEGSYDPAAIDAIGRLTQAMGVQELRQAGKGDWVTYPVRGADDAFFVRNRGRLEGRVSGYDSDRAVWEAVRRDPTLAVLDSAPMQASMMAVGAPFRVEGHSVAHQRFEPFQVEYRDPVSGTLRTVTVIGILSAKIPANIMWGLIVNEHAYAEVYGRPEYQELFLQLTPGADSRAVAKGIKAALVTRGVQAVALDEAIEEMLGQSMGMLRIVQAFMGLGLFVGIAALGVIAFRSVVERRQQIGMLRAIGYQRGTVALSFLLESSFIALMGILSGVIGAVILARNLITSDYFSSTGGLEFVVPWVEVVVMAGGAYIFALLMTYWPSRKAAGAPIAEALRYE